MLYHSAEFAILLAVTAAAFYAVPSRVRPAVLLASSYAFYSGLQPERLGVLVAVTAVAYIGALAVGRRRNRTRLAASVVLLLAPLLTLKYYGFARGLLGGAESLLPEWSPAQPVGISFFTFQAISYVIDVYRGTAEAEPRPLRVALYLSFFPIVLAGPIERASDLMGQFERMQRPSFEAVFTGAKVALWGLFCKLVVADRIAIAVDAVFADPTVQPGAALLAAVYLYTFQIFFDFYGYTTLSVGLARAFGIALHLNFDSPYQARSIRDFWRRWHITLTSWFRDYVYVPLGGRTGSRWGWYRNVIVVFVLSGLWHGAALNFLVWGALHATYYVFGAATAGARERAARAVGLTAFPVVRGVLQRAVTFHLVAAAWLVFRVADPQTIWSVLTGIGRIAEPAW